MASWRTDLIRVIFYSLLITFSSCHPELPCDAAALATRDGSHDSHNWHKVMQTLERADPRIGISWEALLKLQSEMLLIFEEALKDLTFVPNRAYGKPEDKLIEVDERDLIVVKAR